MNENVVVITTIHGITDAVEGFLELDGWDTLLVGDKKTPSVAVNEYDRLYYLSVESQKQSPHSLPKELPYGHYCRKNVGYLEAIRRGYRRISDADDDNLPKEDWEKWPELNGTQEVVTSPRFPNVYQLFTDEHVWPRGYPLTEIRDGTDPETETRALEGKEVAVVQGLADGNPDVDAIHRLVFDDRIEFRNRDPVVLNENVYSPFNSQNTLWTRAAVPYLYLPVTVSFRFTDILRGYVAQRGLWAMGKRLAFRDANVTQHRNPHDLLADFKSEVPCYTQIETVIDALDSVTLDGSPLADLQQMYERLYETDIVDADELLSLDAWISDLQRIENYDPPA